MSGRVIGEGEVLNATVMSEALQNVCVGGRSHDSTLDGDVLGSIGQSGGIRFRGADPSPRRCFLRVPYRPPDAVFRLP